MLHLKLGVIRVIVETVCDSMHIHGERRYGMVATESGHLDMDQGDILQSSGNSDTFDPSIVPISRHACQIMQTHMSVVRPSTTTTTAIRTAIGCREICDITEEDRAVHQIEL